MELTGKPYTDELIRRSYEVKLDKVEVKPSAKSEILFKMKPKIPKSGITLYEGFYIRKLDNTELIYHVESGLFVARMNNNMNARFWIDENEDEILKRVKEVTDVDI